MNVIETYRTRSRSDPESKHVYRGHVSYRSDLKDIRVLRTVSQGIIHCPVLSHTVYVLDGSGGKHDDRFINGFVDVYIVG